MDLAISLLENTWMDNVSHGWGNGYVLLPPEHSMYNVDYTEIDVDVHGGLTYSGIHANTGLWAVGFDTAHMDDTQTSCSKSYVLSETESLRTQLELMS